MIKIGKRAHQPTKKNMRKWLVCIVRDSSYPHSFKRFPYNMREKSHPCRSNIDKSMNGKVLQIMASFSMLKTTKKTANDKLLPNLPKDESEKDKTIFLCWTQQNIYFCYSIVQMCHWLCRRIGNLFELHLINTISELNSNESWIHCYWWPKSVKSLAHWSNEKNG